MPRYSACAQRRRRALTASRGMLAATLLVTGVTAAAARPGALHRATTDRFVGRRIACHTGGDWTRVIVRLDDHAPANWEARLRSIGADVYRHLPLIHAAGVRLPACNLGRLGAMSFVRHISADAQVRKHDEFTVGDSMADMALQQYGLTGAGVTVAVIDSGVHFCKDLQTTNQLSTRVVSRYRVGQPSVEDQCGHGSHVAGIIAGNGAASSGRNCFRTFFGVARQANIESIRVLDCNGQGNVSDVIAAILWVASGYDPNHPRVINLSLGHPVGESYTTDPLCQAVEVAWQAGIVVVCAAGNDGRVYDDAQDGLDNEGYGTNYGSIQSPGNDPYVITVGAMKSTDGVRADDAIATYSSRGPSRLDFVLKPDLVAPGNRVISLNTRNSFLSTAYDGTNQIPLAAYKTNGTDDPSNRYFCLSGTSMAAPVVAGAAALMLQADPTLTPDTIKLRLMLSADKWAHADGTGDPCTYGAGYLNIPAALSCQAYAEDYALSPSLTLGDDGNVYINTDDIFGDRGIWGSGLDDFGAIWGDRGIWGSGGNVLGSSDAISDSGVWDDRGIWGKDTDHADLSSVVIRGE